MAIDSRALRSRFRGAVLGVALGDALGAPYEGVPAPDVRLADLGSRDGLLTYTDDTHMTIGLAQSLLDLGSMDGEHMLATWARNYHAQPWRRYGRTPLVFHLIDAGIAWHEAAGLLFNGEGSFANGGAMRVAPVALFHHADLAACIELARETAALTHAHVLGLEGAILQATALHHVLQLDGPQALEPALFLDSLNVGIGSPVYHLQLQRMAKLHSGATPAEVGEEIGHSVAAFQAVPAAITSFLQAADSFEDVLLFAIRVGGDTDTIASMACSLAGALLGEDAIPQAWRDRLEDVDRLVAIADALWQRTLSSDGPGT
jgi:poly(ADP-ribose) glycohydrolase ARH3